MLLVAALAIGTQSVLLLGYAFAASGLAVIGVLMVRKAMRRIADARLGRPRRLPRLSAATRRKDDETQRLAA